MSPSDREGTVVMNHYNTSPVDHLILSVSILLAYATDLKLTISWEPCIDDFTAMHRFYRCLKGVPWTVMDSILSSSYHSANLNF